MSEEFSEQEKRLRISRAQEAIEVLKLDEKLQNLLVTMRKLQQTTADTKSQKGIKQLGKTVKSMAASSIQGMAMERLMTVLGPLIDLFSIFDVIFEALGIVLLAVFVPVMEDLMPIIMFIVDAIILLIPYAMKLWEIIKFGIVIAIQFFILVIQKAWEGLQAIAKFIAVVFIAMWVGLFTVIQTVWKFISGVFIGIWTTLVNIFQGIATFITTIFITAWNTIVWVFGVVGAAIKFFINGIIGIINFLGNILTFGLFADIPFLAEGGIAVKPTLAVIGEAGPEAIVPLDGAGGGGFGGDNEIHLLDMVEGINTLVSIQRKQSRGLQRRRFG